MFVCARYVDRAQEGKADEAAWAEKEARLKRLEAVRFALPFRTDFAHASFRHALPPLTVSTISRHAHAYTHTHYAHLVGHR